MTRQRTRVKICGITRLKDANLACELGVDALGFVFVPASKRYVTPEEALHISRMLPPFVSVVGLFLDADECQVRQALELMPTMVPQFHGIESSEYCDGFKRPYIKAMGVGKTMPSREELGSFRNATGFLFDSNEPGALGGTGHTFEWARLETRLDARSNTEFESEIDRPLILAGGLTVDNVATAIGTVSPYALDVSSGVESAKGIKSPFAMQQFMRAVGDADALRNQQNNG